MSKLVLILDMDDTLVPFTEVFFPWYEQKYKVELGPRLEDTFNMDRAHGLPIKSSWADLIDEFYTTTTIHLLKPEEETLVALGRLQNYYEMHVVTARPAIHEEKTREFIDTYLDSYIEELHMPTIEGKDFMAANKGLIAKKLNAVALVDDADHNMQSVDKQGVQGILFKKEHHYWNGHDIPSSTIVVSNWRDVVRELDKLHGRES